MKSGKSTPEEREAFRRFREEAHERDRRMREIVRKGLAEIDAKRAQERRETS